MNRSCPIALALVYILAASVDLSAARDGVEGSFQRSIPAAGITDLDVTTGSGRISIRTGSATEVRIDARIQVSTRRRSESEARRILSEIESQPPVDPSATMIRVGYFKDERDWNNVSISYDIVIPVNVRVRSRTGSGSIEILDVADAVRASTGSGTIRASGVRGDFHATTGSGGIRLMHSGAGDVQLSTGSGSIEANGVRGALSASTGSGSIRIDGAIRGRWDVESGSGSVTLRLPAESAFDLDAQAGSGGVSTVHPLTVSGWIKRNRLTGSVRGGGVPLRIRTASGSIRVE